MTDREINANLREIFARLGKIETGLAVISERCPTHHEQIDQHSLILHGAAENGQNPGLIGRVAKLETVQSMYNWGVRALWGVAGVEFLAWITAKLF